MTTKPSSQESRFLSVQETAQYLSLSTITTYRYIKSGLIPAIKIGSRLLIPKQALELLASATDGGKK